MNKQEKVKQELENSAYLFKRYVYPVFQDTILKNKTNILLDFETTTDKKIKRIDNKYGTDYLILTENRWYGIANRVQESLKSWDTFTIRYTLGSYPRNDPRRLDTEYLKRYDAIKYNGIYPYYTVQSYVNKPLGELTFAITKTKDLILFAKSIIDDKSIKFGDKPHRFQIVDGGNTMIVIEWKDYKNRGNWIKTFKQPFEVRTDKEKRKIMSGITRSK